MDAQRLGDMENAMIGKSMVKALPSESIRLVEECGRCDRNWPVSGRLNASK